MGKSRKEKKRGLIMEGLTGGKKKAIYVRYVCKIGKARKECSQSKNLLRGGAIGVVAGPAVQGVRPTYEGE